MDIKVKPEVEELVGGFVEHTEQEPQLTSLEKARIARKDATYEGTGRPTLMTPETIKKLEEVFAIGGSDKEACFYAGISHQTLYNYQKERPEFVERKESLKEKPILKARQTVVNSLGNPEMALKYLERKRKAEFSTRIEKTGEDGGPIKYIITEDNGDSTD